MKQSNKVLHPTNSMKRSPPWEVHIRTDGQQTNCVFGLYPSSGVSRTNRYQTMIKSKNTIRLILIHHCQNPTEMMVNKPLSFHGTWEVITEVTITRIWTLSW